MSKSIQYELLNAWNRGTRNQSMTLFVGVSICLSILMLSGFHQSNNQSTSSYALQSFGTRTTVSGSSQKVLTIEEFKDINSRLISPPKEVCWCGCVDSKIESCPREYDLQDVQLSANAVITKELQDHMDFELMERKRDAQITCLQTDDGGAKQHTNSGGYCLQAFLKLAQDQHQDRGSVIIPFPDRKLPVPKGHVTAPQAVVNVFAGLIEKEGIHTLNDFGAGLGQYGMSLVRRFPNNLLYRGYDGAGDVEVYTQGFLRFFDLTVPMSLPVTDWVMCLEVGEHIPSNMEGIVIRNLHAHNCKGVLLSWGGLGQHGLNHVNLHTTQYLVDIFTELGYVFDEDENNQFRQSLDGSWFSETIMIFRRADPVC